ncbi:hypothetical protein V1477_011426 [Vespula maculifrons]|uniref:Uncharacterized protein n=1 Tax=Vespula maculifrons TaxID=7453 RepID=A0ABD2BZ61_VESMC
MLEDSNVNSNLKIYYLYKVTSTQNNQMQQEQIQIQISSVCHGVLIIFNNSSSPVLRVTYIRTIYLYLLVPLAASKLMISIESNWILLSSSILQK